MTTLNEALKNKKVAWLMSKAQVVTEGTWTKYSFYGKLPSDMVKDLCTLIPRNGYAEHSEESYQTLAFYPGKYSSSKSIFVYSVELKVNGQLVQA